jgi:hypothetical protein
VSHVVQELSLLQPWCPGVTATTAMQRTMSVYSNQFPAIQAAAVAADEPPPPAAAVAAAGGSGVGSSTGSPASGAAVESAVLSIMGASFKAMWDAVGEEGMRPFVVSPG